MSAAGFKGGDCAPNGGEDAFIVGDCRGFTVGGDARKADGGGEVDAYDTGEFV